jgi:predicted dehydrogenase
MSHNEKPFRWGVLGPGSIARKFATGLSVLPDHALVAVGSRSQERSDRFGDEFGVPRRYASYEELAADPAIDAIYVSTPHSFHKEHTLLCLAHGKHVLTEKPFALNAAQGEEMVAAARNAGLFLMEAMWTRFLPIVVEARRLLAEGAIGSLRMVQADFGFRTSFNPSGRLFDPALGGGALLDVGVYPVALAHMLLGVPARVAAVAEIGASGIDEQTGILLGYPGGALALLSTAVTTNTPHEATLMGTDGWIRLSSPWWVGTELVIQRSGREPERVARPYLGNGYGHEAIAVAESVRAGKTEHAVMPLAESLAILRTMDRVREQIGVRYPGE